MFKHIYSGNYLNLDPMKLAKENGCIEVIIFLKVYIYSLQVSLEEVYRTGYSEFKILPSVDLGKQGDVVNYDDLIVVNSFQDENYFLHVC